MVATNPNNRIPFAGTVQAAPGNKLAEREIRFRVQRMTGILIGLTSREYERVNTRPAISDRDLRIHAWLIERQMLLRDEKRKQEELWSKLRRFLFDNRVTRWLGLLSSRI
jgi:hypothetical protein